ncbi:MAG: putative lipid II flippase FtsW [Candidatus Omnitrophica bacterium]|nr:putative lipid II flippase FtsW [Candidatus Omnitrophota bacterium]
MVTATLLAIGLVMIYSASALYADELYGDSTYFLKRHLAYLMMGVALGGLVMAKPYRTLQPYSKHLVLASIVMLVLVLIPGIGTVAGGARRWFRLGQISLQPSELAQFALLVYLADVLSRKQAAMHSLVHGFLPPMAVVGLLSLLVLVQPDLGTAFSFMAVAVCLFIIAKIRWSYLASMGLASLPALWMLIWHVEYRRRRFLAFLDPWADPRGTGFQIVQSYLALGSGGLVGVGLGRSVQKLFYLPGAHTDFIFAVLGEELGLLGTLSVVGLFILFILLGLRVAIQTHDLFGKLIAGGVTVMVGLEALINLCVVTGLIPTKGLPLPFISYGGSSFMMTLVGVGLLLNVARDTA